MILFNGCSFTRGEKRRNGPHEIYLLESAYPKFLGDALDKTIWDISMSGKDNLTMISDLITLLMWKEHSHKSFEKQKDKKIDMIVLQPTDFFRCYLPTPKFKKHHKINNLDSQLSFIGDKWTKMMMHRSHMLHMKKFGSSERCFRLVPDDPRTETKFIGDTSETFMKYQWCQKLIHLQLLCEVKKIKLVIMNYYPIGEDFKEDPSFKAIDLDNFIIEDPFKSGMYEQLEIEAFTKTEDDFHWEIDAHAYQADILEDFIKNNTKIKVKSNIESHTTEIYDYTT